MDTIFDLKLVGGGTLEETMYVNMYICSFTHFIHFSGIQITMLLCKPLRDMKRSFIKFAGHLCVTKCLLL